MRRATSSARTLVLLLLAATVPSGCGRESGPSGPPPNVILVSIDTLRADHVSCYGYRLPTTPAIDALAARGVRFDDVTVPTPKTWPSVATLLTGTAPRTHGVRLANRQLREDLPVLAERFRDAGYRTGGVVTNFNLLEGWGYGRGFEWYLEAWDELWPILHPDRPLPDDPKERLGQLFSGDGRAMFQAMDAEFVTDRALAWLSGIVTVRSEAAAAASGERDPPFFLWLHYMDPHGPYDPPASYARTFAGKYPVEEVPREELRSPHLHTRPGEDGPVTDLGFYKARYDREIRSTDDQLARLFAWLEDRRLTDDTLVVLTADHGEALGQHGYYFEHGLQPYQECARVPLIVSRPGTLPEGAVVGTPVGLIDVPGTVLELAGLEVPDTDEGTSLAGLVRGEPGARGPEHVFMESGDDRFADRALQLTVRQGGWKLVQVPTEADRARLGGAAFELYDLAADADETTNVATAPGNAPIVGKLFHELQVWEAAHPVGEGVLQGEFEQTLDPASREILKALGYLGGDGEEDAPATDEDDGR